MKGRIGIFAGVSFLAIGVVATSGSASAEPSSPPAGTRPLYVTNADDSMDISTFTVDVGNGRPVLSADRAKAGEGVRQMAFTPDARAAYAANADERGTISAYSVGPQGKLTRLPRDAGTVQTGGDTPLGISVRPDGHTLFVAHVISSTVASFTIAADGSLTPLETKGTSVPNPRGLAVTPDGRFLYLGHGDPGEGRPDSVGAITAFAIDRNGRLKPLGSPIRVGKFCGDLAITPDGRRIYMICQDTDNIFGFAIGSGGELTPLPGSPYKVSDFPEGIVTSPDGRFVYATSVGAGGFGEGPGAVSGFAIAGDGALKEVPGSPYLGGDQPGDFGIFPVGITILPNGRFVYASGGDDTGQLMAFKVGPGGTLLPFADSPFDTGGRFPAYDSAAVLPDQGPVAAFRASAAGRTVTFDGSASTDSDGSVASYRWDFGDGTTQTTANPRTTHVYPRAGTFRATLVVTDNEGCSTALISTGQIVLCNGSTAATTTYEIVVRG
jgi:6-phosphogluconolactonase (cycloisomerase 2 family)